MADPAALPQPMAAPGLTPQGDLQGQWMQYLTSEPVRAALMQFGVGMLQPRQGGQSFGGQVGQSFGEAGQAAGRVRAQELEQAQIAQRNQMDNARLDIEQGRLTEEQKQTQIAQQRAGTEAAESSARTKTAADQLALDKEKLGLDRLKAKSLDLYYKSLANASTVKAAPPGYKEALDAAKEASLLADDPMAAFLENLQKVNLQFGMGGGAPAGGTTTPTTAAAGTSSTPVDTSKIPAEAIQILKASPTPENKAFFEQTFGPGTADAVIGAQ